MYAALYEQQIAFASSGWRVVAKTVENRKFGVRASYPQLAAADGAQLAPAAQHFNALLEKKVGDEARSFGEAMEGEPNVYFHANYNVLAATDDLVSVEISEYVDGGGAHPNSYYDAVTYDLRAGRPVALAALFKPGAKYEEALRRAALAGLQAQARRVAAENNEPNAESLFNEPGDVGEWSAWGLTPRGLVLYFDRAHVDEVFDKVLIPWQELREVLDPKGPAARFTRAAK
jgi:hypothetical protein